MAHDLLQGGMFFKQCAVSLLKLSICILYVILAQVLCMHGACVEVRMSKRARLECKADFQRHLVNREHSYNMVRKTMESCCPSYLFKVVDTVSID
jgi:hypothetical protein